MEESQIPSGVETPSTPADSTSLPSKLMDVFIAPGEVFENIKTSPPNAANWIVPLVISIILGIVSSLVIFSQPTIIQHLKDTQHQAFEKQVQAGKMTQQQADQAEETTQKFMGATAMKIFGTFGNLIGMPIVLFFVALVLWLLGKLALHATFPYMQAVEVSGLAMMITALGALVTTVLACIKGNMLVNLGPSLFVDHLEQTNKVHAVLIDLNLMTFWYIAVLAIGLGKVSGTGWVKPAVWLFGIWAVCKALGLVLF